MNTNDDPTSLAPRKYFQRGTDPWLYQISEQSATHVALCRQGGGFVQRLPLHVFSEQFTEAQLPEFTLSRVTGEWLDGDTSLLSYSNGRRWNGWAMPYFTKEAGLQLITLMPGMSYDPSNDAFVFLDDGDIGPASVYPAERIVANHQVVTVYGIGTGCWTWEYSVNHD